MTTVSLEEAQSTLTDLIHRLNPGDEGVITEKNQVINGEPHANWN